MQSKFHWSWVKVQGSKIEDRLRYLARVWNTFPWPQEPSVSSMILVAQAARNIRAVRALFMAENRWSLRQLHQAAEVEGSHPLKDAQAALDEAVAAAYGIPASREITEFLLELNLCLAEDEAEGHSVQGPGLPAGFDPKDPRWFSEDCIKPPPLE
jgi:hypothetical protein